MSPRDNKTGGIFANDIEFNHSDFRYVAEFARKQFGISLSEGKMPLVQSRISRRLRKLSLTSFSQYRRIIEDPAEHNERSELLSTLTTNVTHFFREKHHFEALEKHIFPNLHESLPKDQPIRVWSAGCSTGQEPCSIALSFLSTSSKFPARKIEITATDVDNQVLSKAKRFSYDGSEIDRLPQRYRNQVISHKDSFTFSKDVSSIIKYSQLNLMDDPSFREKFDLIFCRNVAIYFDRATQERIWVKFHKYLRTMGYLFIGHSERISGPATHNFYSEGITTYQRVS